jgi:membrane associated rhomboid family serine protease
LNDQFRTDAPETEFGNFPTPLSGHPYGYLLKGKLHGCSREELLRKCSSRGFRNVQMVWTPENSHLVPVAVVPFLFDTAVSAYRFRLRASLALTILLTIILAYMAKSSWPDERSFSLLIIAALVLVGVLPSIRTFKMLRGLAGVTADSFGDSHHFSRPALWVASQNTIGTKILAAGMIAAGAAQLRAGMEPSLYAAALIKDLVRAGEHFRLFSCVWLHGGLLHFGLNFMALMNIGRMVEALGNRALVLIVFAVSAATGSLFSFWLMPHITSVGASGGIMGLIGFLAVLGQRRRGLLPSGFGRAIWMNIAFIAALGLAAFQMVDNAAHLGGLVGGAACGLAFIPVREKKLPIAVTPVTDSFGWISLGLIIASVAVTVEKVFSYVP